MNAGTDWQAISNTVDAMVTALNNAERAVIAALERGGSAGDTEDGEGA